MGCSPSKGNAFGTLGPSRKGRMLPPAPQETPREPPFETGEKQLYADGDTKERRTHGQTPVSQRESHMTPQKKKPVTELTPEVAVRPDINMPQQRKEKIGDKHDVTEKKSGKKAKKNTRGTKITKKREKEKEDLSAVQKVDFPEPLVKAHQAAYAFLNPSINRYDVALGLLEQATQTQASVQPMVAFMALRYEEITQVLEEMAEEGEKVLKENGEHLAWPSPEKNPASDAAGAEPPPDLLQQLLQYTTQRMRNVSQTVGALGNSALEEAVEYFASVSDLLEEKLKAKRAAESRLTRLLSRIEMASSHKPGPEDSSLFSEDSGIGAENESLAGSERNHRRESCESTGTSRTTPVSPAGFTSINVRQGVLKEKLTGQISPSVSLTSLNTLGSTCTLMDIKGDSLLGSISFDEVEPDDADRDKMDEHLRDGQAVFRERSNSSASNPEKRLSISQKMKNAVCAKVKFIPPLNPSAKPKLASSPKTSRCQWSDEKERSPKTPRRAAPAQRAAVRTSPAAKQRRSRSAESVPPKREDPMLLELQRTQKNLSQRLQKISKTKTGGPARTTPPKQVRGSSPTQSASVNHRNPSLERNGVPQPRHIDQKPEGGEDDEEDNKPKNQNMPKGPVKATPPPSPPPSPRPSSGLYRGRNSVKKLIDTFSQGIEELDGPKVLGPLKGVRKCGVPVMPGLGNMEAALSTGKTGLRTKCASSEKMDDLDLDSLPPPALEVLLDNSFESAQSLSAGSKDESAAKAGKSPLMKRTVVSQRLRASVQSVSVLPSKGGLKQGPRVVAPAMPNQQVPSVHPKFSQADPEANSDPGKERTSPLFPRASKTANPKHPSEAQAEKATARRRVTMKCVGQEDSTDVEADGEPSAPSLNTNVSTVPPSSAASRPPASPLASKGRMLPSTPSAPSTSHRRLPSPNRRQPTPPSATSPVNRNPPTPPDAQRRLPSPPATRQNLLNSYPFKAPSPPASPKVHRLSRENSAEESRIGNARSVFCPASPSLFEAHSCAPPQAWTSAGVSFLSRPSGNRGRLPVSVGGPRPFIRRSHSERRPSLSHPPPSPGVSAAETCGSEPALWSQGLSDEPSREDEVWGGQSDLRWTPRSASHPDLCVVGQSLHRN